MTQKLKDLLISFHSQGRRYSYYPSLPDWSGSDNKEHLLEGLALQDVNLYIHIPFCASLCTFCGCNIKVTKLKEQFRKYIDKVLYEWEHYKRAYPGLNLCSIYLGGGTPSYLELGDLKYLIDNILKDTKVDTSFFGTMETDPRLEQVEKLSYLASVGFNSLSIGVQDTDKETLLNVNRDQSFEQVEYLVQSARKLGYTEINLDLIYGLPFQTDKSFSKTLEDILSLRPERIANYPLAKVPWQMDLQNAFGLYRPLNTYEMYDLYILSDEILKDADYRLLGMGHYSNTNHHYSRNITGYNRAKKGSLISLGTSSISNTDDYLYQNDKILEKYMLFPMKAIKTHHKTTREKMLESLFSEVNCSSLISKSLLSECYDREQTSKLAKSFTHFINNGIIVEMPEAYVITDFGRHFNKTICQTLEII